MRSKVPRSFRYVMPLVVLAVSVGFTQAPVTGGRGAATATDTLVIQVRAALGHGAVEDAQKLAETASGPAVSRELAAALVEIFQGKDDAARARLQPLANSITNREAALELALLEWRHGQRDTARRRLMPLTIYGSLRTADDYLVLVRAARATDQAQVANAAYNAYDKLPALARADVFTERGDLFMQFHQPGDAVTEYRKALKADAQWVPAHLGIARAMGADDPEEAAVSIEDARVIAPDHPDLWLLTAEHALGTDNEAGAKEALDRVAKVRPGSVREAALRGAVAYAERRPADVEAAIARVAAIDPSSAAGFKAAGESAARKYRFEDAAAYARRGVALDPEDAGLQAALGLYLLRTGDEPAARTGLEASWALDKSDPVTKNLLDLLDHLDKFDVVPDGDLIFKFPKDQTAVLKPYALPLGQLAYKTFTERYGFKPQGPILIEMFGIHDDFAVRTIGLAGITGALGACFGRVVTMDSPKARPPGEFSWQATEWHELAHVFTLQLSQYRVPRWLTEGMSAYEEHRRVPAWGRELTLEFARKYSQNKTFGVKGLPDAFKHPETLALAYFEASLVIEHLVELNGDAGVRTLLRAYADGATDAEAFAKAFGKSIDEADASFAAFIKLRYSALGVALANPPSDVDNEDVAGLKARAAAAPGNFYSQWSYGRALVQSGDLAGAKAPLERAVQLVPDATGAGSPHTLLADIAEKEGDIARARKELRELLVFDHTNIAAARRLAVLAAKSNAPDDQDIGLRLIADLDPFDGEVHGLLGRRERAKGHQAAALIEFQAALALGPPSLGEAHTDLGEVLLTLGRRDEARKEALLALQAAPAFARAQDLLLAASVR